MKKIILVAAVLFSSAYAANAQVAKGNLFLGGGLGFNSGSSESTTGSVTVDGPKTSTFFIAPQAGYFLTDNIAAGVMLDFRNTTSKSTNGAGVETESKSSGFGFGVFGRYYKPINEQFYFWGQLGVMMGSGKSESTTGNVTVDGPKTSSFDVAVRPGFSFYPSTRYGFDFSVGRLGVTSTKSTSNNGANPPVETENKTSDFGLNFDMTAITIGVTVFFGGGE